MISLLLTEFYHDWLNTDVPLGESLRDTLEDSVAMLTRYYGKQNKFRIDEEIFGVKGGVETFVNGGAVAPLVAAILCAVFAYVVPKNKAKSKSKK